QMGALYVERVVDQRLDARNKALGVRLLGVALERRLLDPARVDEEQSVTCPRFFIPPERECGVGFELAPNVGPRAAGKPRLHRAAGWPGLPATAARRSRRWSERGSFCRRRADRGQSPS